MGGPFPDVGNQDWSWLRAGRKWFAGAVSWPNGGSSRQSDAWDWSSYERAGPEMPVGSPEVKGGLVWEQKSLLRQCVQQEGWPGTESQGTSLSKAWAEEEGSQERW